MMSAANPQHAGETVMITRRTVLRQFLLRPDSAMFALFAYLFAHYVSLHDQLVSAVCVLSNHYHAVLTDNFFGAVSKRWRWTRDFHSRLSRVRSRQLGRTESLFNTSPPGNTTLYDRDAAIRLMVYTWLQPVEAGLVERVEDWPGFQILPRHWGRELAFERPDLPFFRSKIWPERASFVPLPPPCLQDIPLADAIAFCEWLISEEETRYANERQADGTTVLGAKAAAEVNPFSSPTTPAETGRVNPKIATKDPDLLDLAKAVLRVFRDAYKSARERFRAGQRGAVHPAGTVAAAEYLRVSVGRLPSEHPAVWQTRLPHMRAARESGRWLLLGAAAA